MRASDVAIHVNQPGLDDVVSGLRGRVIPAAHDVGFKHVIIAENVLNAANRDQRAERSATAISISKVFRPSARCAELNRGRLFCRVANATNRFASHGAKLIGQMNLHTDAAKFAGQTANHFAGIRCIAIDINSESERSACVNAHGGAENFRLLHQVRRDLTLHGYHGSNCGMIIIKQARRGTSESAKRRQK